MSAWKLAIMAAGTALLLTACGGSTPTTGDGSGCTPKGGSTTATATTTVKLNPDPNTVGRYDPQSISVTTGQSVEWDWVDNSSQHSVTSDDNTTFDSCLQNAGAKFIVTFNTAGTITYHCQIHAAMTGTIKVS